MCSLFETAEFLLNSRRVKPSNCGQDAAYLRLGLHSCNTCLGCMFSDGALVLEKVVLDLDEPG